MNWMETRGSSGDRSVESERAEDYLQEQRQQRASGDATRVGRSDERREQAEPNRAHEASSRDDDLSASGVEEPMSRTVTHHVTNARARRVIGSEFRARRTNRDGVEAFNANPRLKPVGYVRSSIRRSAPCLPRR
jgi:hypothetical protein